MSGAAGIDQLTITNCDFTSNYQNGIEIQANSVSAVTNTTITGSNFTDNGGQFVGDPVHSSSGDGDILFFGYGGNASLSNLTLTNGSQDGTVGIIPPNTKYAENGIQFRADTGSLGTVTLNGHHGQRALREAGDYVQQLRRRQQPHGYGRGRHGR